MPQSPDRPKGAALPIGLQWTPRYVSSLLRDLAAIQDIRIRTLALAERFESLPAEDDIIAAVRGLVDALQKGNPDAPTIIACFHDSGTLAERFGKVRMETLAARARSQGHPLVAQLLSPPEDTAQAHGKTHHDLRGLTLGERKSLAKTAHGEMLLKLLHDEHPHVQELILHNPRLTVRDIVMVAAKRPAAPHVLRGIAMHHRWMHRYEVRCALVKNPDTPIDVAGRLVVMLAEKDLREVMVDERISEELRRLAEHRLGRTNQVWEIDEDDAAPLPDEWFSDD